MSFWQKVRNPEPDLPNRPSPSDWRSEYKDATPEQKLEIARREFLMDNSFRSDRHHGIYYPADALMCKLDQVEKKLNRVLEALGDKK